MQWDFFIMANPGKLKQTVKKKIRIIFLIALNKRNDLKTVLLKTESDAFNFLLFCDDNSINNNLSVFFSFFFLLRSKICLFL